MKALPFEKLANPEFLRQVQTQILYSFLHKHEEYFKSIPMDLKVPDPKDTQFYKDIASALMNPSRHENSLELFDELFLVREATDSVDYDKLLDIIEKSEYKSCLDHYENPGKEDLAMLIMINNRRDLERICVEQDLSKRKSYMCFSASPGKPLRKFNPINKKFLDDLTSHFNYSFMVRKRGKKSAEIMHEQPDEKIHQFIIRKGAPMSRQEAIEESGDSSTAIFRPATYDLVVFRPKKRELRISMPVVANWALELYRKKFGEFLYDDVDYFSPNDLISLEPLKKYGRGVMKCDDIVDENGYKLIDNVRMTNCAVLYDQNNNEKVIYKGDSVFNLWDKQDISLNDGAEPSAATFKVKPKYSDKECSVTITQGNKASYLLNNDSPAIESWLREREFINGNADEEEL